MKKLLLFVVGTMLVFSVYGQSNLPPCQGSDVTKWSNCFGTYKLNGVQYVGEFEDGKYHGQGTFIFSSGEKYVGEFKDGAFNGQGTYTAAIGDKYVGEFKHGMYHGKGVLTLKDGRILDGFWVDDEFLEKGRSQAITLSDLLSEDINTSIFNNRWSGRIVIPAGTLTKTEKQVGDFSLDGDFYKAGNGYFKNLFFVTSFEVGVFVPKDKKKSAVLYVYQSVEASPGYDFGKDPVTYNPVHHKSTIVESSGIPLEDKTPVVNRGTFRSRDPVLEDKARQKFISRPSQQTDLALNEDRSRLEADRQALAERERRFDEERRKREQAKQSSKLSLQASTTKPDANGIVIITVRTNTDTSSLKVNGNEEGSKLDGNYAIKRVAKVSQDTEYTIVATDVFGNVASTTITVARQAVSQASNQSVFLKPENIKRVPTRDAVAIIIGIQNYKRVPKAEFANNDAKEFYEYAIRGLGIKPENIKLLVDEEADEVNIVKAFENWLPLQVNKAKTDVYVFYSGHGLPSNDGKSLYFLPHGVDKELLSRTAVGQAEIVSALVASKPKSVTMFIDACYSGQTRGGEVLLASAKPISLKTDANAFPLNFTVITASSNDQISSSSPELKHGIFSFYLMKGMEGDADGNKDGKITAGEMQEYLSDKVSRQAMSINRKQDTQLVGDPSRVLVGQK